MKTEWDYTTLAAAYLKRPDYSKTALDAMIEKAQLKPGSRVCDVGAGVAHLTIPLAKASLLVDAVEPNDEMRKFCKDSTKQFNTVTWTEGTGEQTTRPSATYHAVTFGSSFNVTNRPAALIETKRLLLPKGWFACMWNHRNLEDPIQKKVEQIITGHVPEYGYGTRRENQTAVINESGLFGPVVTLEGNVMHTVSVKDYVDAWKSHATLHRQAKDKFETVIQEIGDYCESLRTAQIEVPYTTRIWMAQLK